MSFLSIFLYYFLMFFQIEGSRSNKETSISPCAILLRFFHPIRKLNGCVSTLCFFLYANRGFHVEICAKTRVSLHSQLHSNYVVFALLLYECRTVAVKKCPHTTTRGNLCNNSVPICLLIGLFREIQCIFTP